MLEIPLISNLIKQISE